MESQTDRDRLLALAEQKQICLLHLLPAHTKSGLAFVNDNESTVESLTFREYCRREGIDT